jgi:hypothetical protein
MRTFALDPATATIARLITITRRDGTILRLTPWPRAIHIGDEVWLPATGLKTFNIGERSNGEPASTQLQLSASSGGIVTEIDIEDELYVGADVEIFLTDADNPAAKDFEFFGRIGSWSFPAHDVCTFNLKNPLAFPRHNLVPAFSVMCRFALGDQFCGVPIMRPEVTRSTAYALGESVRHLTGAAPAGYGNVYFETTTAGTTAATAPSYNYSVGATTTDGSAVFTARNAYERACEIAAVVNQHNMTLTASPDPRAVDNWYAPGKIQFASGRFKGRTYKIGGWRASDLQLTTYLPAGLCVQPGDTALIWKDCNKTIAQCEAPFDNVRRFGGFPYYEGAKAVALEQEPSNPRADTV